MYLLEKVLIYQKSGVSYHDEAALTLKRSLLRFQHICYCVMDDESLSREKFVEELLPAMLKMAADPIVNVRITLGKTLAHHVITSGRFVRVLRDCHILSDLEATSFLHNLKTDI